jgi:hypothetical protein
MRLMFLMQKAYSNAYAEGYKARTGHYPSDAVLLIAVPASISGLIYGLKLGAAIGFLLAMIGFTLGRML